MAKRVMVVEDNLLNMKLVRTLLQLEGYEVVEVTSGEEVLSAVAQRRPDLILMDVQLPGIDGLEVCARLKSDAQTAAIPVVALTSYAMAGDEKKAQEAGCDGYITKPIETQSFGSTIARYFPTG
jgi:CheY-like chemotaxis protein